MDTKLKKSKKVVRNISVVITVIAVVIAAISLCAIAVAQNVYYDAIWAGEKPQAALENAAGEILTVCVVSAITALIFFIISVFTTAKKGENIKLNWFDKLYMEIKIGLGLVLVLLVILISEALILCLEHSGVAMYMWRKAGIATSINDGVSFGVFPDWAAVWISILGLIIVVSIYMAIAISIVKQLRNHSFFANFAVVEGITKLVNVVRESERTELVVIAVLVAGIVLSATIFGSVLVLALTLIFVPKLLLQYREIRTGVSKVKEGEVSYKIPVTSKTDLGRLAEDINQVSSATELAIEKELKHQKMKTDLISNVSHDLKTPLTSMISYVDLLKREGLQSENAEEYLRIIDEKTKRLKNLTENLFEAAKASSGEIPVNMETLQVDALFNQAVAELEEKFEKRNLEIIYENKTENDEIISDGQLLWRIIENLLVNVSKYALENSRVYIDLYNREDKVVLEIKNMSKDRLNISIDELLERFTRGDESRNTEGSGLGLAIAKDLTELIGGEFAIKIDGDLFKAIVSLPKGK